MTVAEADRKNWMGLCARAPQGMLSELLAKSETPCQASFLRAPEIGSVMVRGRTGGNGSAFNLGEMTVTRCTVRLDCGTVGHGHIQGRRKEDAEAAAKIDALMQTAAADQVRQSILEPLREKEGARKRDRSDKAAATKVDFFTMVRGEDE